MLYKYNMISQLRMFTKRDFQGIIGMWASGGTSATPLEDRFPFGARLIFRGELLKSPSGTCILLALFFFEYESELPYVNL